MAVNGIKHHVFDMKGTKKEAIPIQTMKAILRLVLDQRHHPLLIHCNHGKVCFALYLVVEKCTKPLLASHWLCCCRGPKGVRVGAVDHHRRIQDLRGAQGP
jgi:hypothetical protein